jgi:hypothetical protein
MKFFYNPKLIVTSILLLIATAHLYPQKNNYSYLDAELVGISNSLNSLNRLAIRNSDAAFQNSLAFKNNFQQKWGTVNLPQQLLNDDFKPWESEKHFWLLLLVKLLYLNLFHGHLQNGSEPGKIRRITGQMFPLKRGGAIFKKVLSMTEITF